MKYILEVRILSEDSKHIVTERLVKNISLLNGQRLINFMKLIFNILKQIKKGDIL